MKKYRIKRPGRGKMSVFTGWFDVAIPACATFDVSARRDGEWLDVWIEGPTKESKR